MMLVLLATDVPIALQATQANAVGRIEIVKLVTKTVYLGLLFGIAYTVAGIRAIRQALGESRG